MTKYWIGVASYEHVKKGVEGGFAQVCHGKGGPLKRMSPGDWIIYYSPTELFGGQTPYRKFSALGQIKAGDPYEFCMSNDFIPWRRNVNFIKINPAEIKPLITELDFIKNKQSWGFIFRRGCFEISEKDFKVITEAMEASYERSN